MQHQRTRGVVLAVILGSIAIAVPWCRSRANSDRPGLREDRSDASAPLAAATSGAPEIASIVASREGRTVDPTLAIVVGRVVDRRSPEVALPEVRIVLAASRADVPDGPESAQGPTATTDVDGGFRIEGLPIGARFMIAATKPGYRAYVGKLQQPLVAGVNDFESLTLMRGTSIMGFVRDEGGRPLSAATVRLYEESFAFGRAPGGTRQRTAEQVTATGPDGSYSFSHALRWFSVEAVCESFGSERSGELCSDALPTHAVDFSLSRALPLSGRVIDDLDLPVPWAVVRIEAQDDGDAGTSAETRADGDGRFQFDSVAPVPTRLFAEQDGFAPATTAVDPKGGASVVRLLRFGAIEGTLDPSFELGAERYLEAVLVPQDRDGEVPRYSRPVERDGRTFRCDRLRSGDYRLLLTFAGHPLRAPDLIGVLPGESVDLGVLAPAVPRSARGRVRFANGDPARDAKVQVQVIEPATFSPFHEGDSRSGRFVEPQADGWFVLEELPEASCDVAARLKGHWVEPARIPALGVDRVLDLPDLILRPVATLTGTLTSRDGVPLVRRRVELRLAGRLQTTWTDTKGVYRFEELRAGSATLRVNHRDPTAPADREVVLEDGATVTADFER